MGRIERFVGTRMQREQVMTADQVEQMRREALVDDILEKAAMAHELPEELRDLDMPEEKLMCAMFHLLVERGSREIQSIPEDRPKRRGRVAEDELPVEKGNDWSLQESVTLFMNAGKMLHIRPKDIAGLLYNEGGAPKGSIGDIRMFPKHSLIEVSPEVAPQLVQRLATATVCGYEVNIREDKGKPAPRPAFRQEFRQDFRPRERRRREGGFYERFERRPRRR